MEIETYDRKKTYENTIQEQQKDIDKGLIEQELYCTELLKNKNKIIENIQIELKTCLIEYINHIRTRIKYKVLISKDGDDRVYTQRHLCEKNIEIFDNDTIYDKNIQLCMQQRNNKKQGRSKRILFYKQQDRLQIEQRYWYTELERLCIDICISSLQKYNNIYKNELNILDTYTDGLVEEQDILEMYLQLNFNIVNGGKTCIQDLIKKSEMEQIFQNQQKDNKKIVTNKRQRRIIKPTYIGEIINNKIQQNVETNWYIYNYNNNNSKSITTDKLYTINTYYKKLLEQRQKYNIIEKNQKQYQLVENIDYDTKDKIKLSWYDIIVHDPNTINEWKYIGELRSMQQYYDEYNIEYSIKQYKLLKSQINLNDVYYDIQQRYNTILYRWDMYIIWYIECHTINDTEKIYQDSNDGKSIQEAQSLRQLCNTCKITTTDVIASPTTNTTNNIDSSIANITVNTGNSSSNTVYVNIDDNNNNSAVNICTNDSSSNNKNIAVNICTNDNSSNNKNIAVNICTNDNSSNNKNSAVNICTNDNSSNNKNIAVNICTNDNSNSNKNSAVDVNNNDKSSDDNKTLPLSIDDPTNINKLHETNVISSISVPSESKKTDPTDTSEIYMDPTNLEALYDMQHPKEWEDEQEEPNGFIIKLYKYQRRALSWMLYRERRTKDTKLPIKNLSNKQLSIYDLHFWNLQRGVDDTMIKIHTNTIGEEPSYISEVSYKDPFFCVQPQDVYIIHPEYAYIYPGTWQKLPNHEQVQKENIPLQQDVRGGIQADAMGLGKTIEIQSQIQSNKSNIPYPSQPSYGYIQQYWQIRQSDLNSIAIDEKLFQCSSCSKLVIECEHLKSKKFGRYEWGDYVSEYDQNIELQKLQTYQGDGKQSTTINTNIKNKKDKNKNKDNIENYKELKKEINIKLKNWKKKELNTYYNKSIDRKLLEQYSGNNNMLQMNFKENINTDTTNTNEYEQLLSPATQIVCPISQIGQWKEEIVKCIPNLKAVYYDHEWCKIVNDDINDWYKEWQGSNNIQDRENQIKKNIYKYTKIKNKNNISITNTTTNNNTKDIWKIIYQKEQLEADIVLTTYDILRKEIDYNMDIKYTLRYNKDHKVISPQQCIHWHRIVQDESQYIRSGTTNVCTMASRLSSTYRWAISGTPIRETGGLCDILGMLQFLRLAPSIDINYNNYSTISQTYDDIYKSEIINKKKLNDLKDLINTKVYNRLKNITVIDKILKDCIKQYQEWFKIPKKILSLWKQLQIQYINNNNNDILYNKLDQLQQEFVHNQMLTATKDIEIYEWIYNCLNNGMYVQYSQQIWFDKNNIKPKDVYEQNIELYLQYKIILNDANQLNENSFINNKEYIINTIQGYHWRIQICKKKSPNYDKDVQQCIRNEYQKKFQQIQQMDQDIGIRPQYKIQKRQMWRNSKKHVTDEIHLPGQYTQTIYLKFSPVELYFYKTIQERLYMRVCGEEFVDQNTTNKNTYHYNRQQDGEQFQQQQYSVQLDEVRGSCCHPQVCTQQDDIIGRHRRVTNSSSSSSNNNNTNTSLLRSLNQQTNDEEYQSQSKIRDTQMSLFNCKVDNWERTITQSLIQYSMHIQSYPTIYDIDSCLKLQILIWNICDIGCERILVNQRQHLEYLLDIPPHEIYKKSLNMKLDSILDTKNNKSIETIYINRYQQKKKYISEADVITLNEQSSQMDINLDFRKETIELESTDTQFRQWKMMEFISLFHITNIIRSKQQGLPSYWYYMVRQPELVEQKRATEISEYYGMVDDNDNDDTTQTTISTSKEYYYTFSPGVGLYCPFFHDILNLGEFTTVNYIEWETLETEYVRPIQPYTGIFLKNGHLDMYMLDYWDHQIDISSRQRWYNSVTASHDTTKASMCVSANHNNAANTDMSNAVNTNTNSAVNTDMNDAVNTNTNSAVNTDMNDAVDTNINSAVNTDMNSAVNTNTNSAVNTNTNSTLNINTNSSHNHTVDNGMKNDEKNNIFSRLPNVAQILQTEEGQCFIRTLQAEEYIVPTSIIEEHKEQLHQYRQYRSACRSTILDLTDDSIRTIFTMKQQQNKQFIQQDGCLKQTPRQKVLDNEQYNLSKSQYNMLNDRLDDAIIRLAQQNWLNSKQKQYTHILNFLGKNQQCYDYWDLLNKQNEWYKLINDIKNITIVEQIKTINNSNINLYKHIEKGCIKCTIKKQKCIDIYNKLLRYEYSEKVIIDIDNTIWFCNNDIIRCNSETIKIKDIDNTIPKTIYQRWYRSCIISFGSITNKQQEQKYNIKDKQRIYNDKYINRLKRSVDTIYNEQKIINISIDIPKILNFIPLDKQEIIRQKNDSTTIKVLKKELDRCWNEISEIVRCIKQLLEIVRRRIQLYDQYQRHQAIQQACYYPLFIKAPLQMYGFRDGEDLRLGVELKQDNNIILLNELSDNDTMIRLNNENKLKKRILERYDIFISVLQAKKNMEKSQCRVGETAIMAIKVEDVHHVTECVICSNIQKDAIVTWCGHLYCRNCITLWQKRNDTCPLCRQPQELSRKHLFSPRSIIPKDNTVINDINNNDDSGQLDDSTNNEWIDIRNIQFPHPSRIITKVPIVCDKGTKITTIVKMIKYYVNIHSSNNVIGERNNIIERLHLTNKQDIKGNKIIVFSQFPRMLELIGQTQKKNGIRYLLQKGTTKKRANIVENFKQDKNERVQQMNQLSDNSGQTLHCAQHIFFCESSQDKSLESQAVARVHRIGQERECCVHRFLYYGSIENHIFQMQNEREIHQVLEKVHGELDPLVRGTEVSQILSLRNMSSTKVEDVEITSEVVSTKRGDAITKEQIRELVERSVSTLDIQGG